MHAEGLQEGFHVGYDLAVEQVDRARCVGGVVLRVGYHYDGRALLVQFGQQIHDLFAVLRVEVAGGLIGEDSSGSKRRRGRWRRAAADLRKAVGESGGRGG